MTEADMRYRLAYLLRAVALAVVDREVLVYVDGIKQLLIRCLALIAYIIFRDIELKLLIYMRREPSLVVLAVYSPHGKRLKELFA